jgi:hypothetical protein
MGRTCLNCNKELIIGKTLIQSEIYRGLTEVQIHVECRRCIALKSRIQEFSEKRRELGKEYRELTQRIKTYKGLYDVVGNRDLQFLETKK